MPQTTIRATKKDRNYQPDRDGQDSRIEPAPEIQGQEEAKQGRTFEPLFEKDLPDDDANSKQDRKMCGKLHALQCVPSFDQHTGKEKEGNVAQCAGMKPFTKPEQKQANQAIERDAGNENQAQVKYGVGNGIGQRHKQTHPKILHAAGLVNAIKGPLSGRGDVLGDLEIIVGVITGKNGIKKEFNRLKRGDDLKGDGGNEEDQPDISGPTRGFKKFRKHVLSFQKAT
ncbi:MAG: hypothetical protein WBA91_06465 [Paracoccaceae bacterium]